MNTRKHFATFDTTTDDRNSQYGADIQHVPLRTPPHQIHPA